MAHKTSDVASFSLDDESGVLVDISGSINSIALNGGQSLVPDTGTSDGRRTVLGGLVDSYVYDISGWVDSTTEAIVTPIVDGTSITKTMVIELSDGAPIIGEVWPEEVKIGANMGVLQTFSMRLRLSVGAALGSAYLRKVLLTEPANLIGYWPLNETAGTNADNAEGTAARDGTYTGVSLNNSTGPDGQPVGLWDGANDYCNIYSTSLNTAFNGAAGTLALWLKVSSSGTWTDETTRYAAYIYVDANNYVFLRQNGNGTIRAEYKAGGTVEVVATAYSATTWTHYAITWDKAGDKAIIYINGVQNGATQSGLGVWAGALAAANTVVGSISIGPATVWDGYLAHAAIWTTPLSAAQIASLATV